MTSFQMVNELEARLTNLARIGTRWKLIAAVGAILGVDNPSIAPSFFVSYPITLIKNLLDLSSI